MRRGSESVGGEPPSRLSPWDIDFDPENPRQENEDKIEGDAEFVRLKESIIQHGVLVPLVVRESARAPRRWVLIDGERRLRAARDVNLPDVPVNVARGNRTDALAQAFHIHTLRKEWGNTAQVRVIRRMKESAPHGVRSDPTRLRDWIRDLTGYGADRAATLIQVAEDYPEGVLQEVDRGQLAWSTLVQIRESFIAQVRNKFPELLKDMGEEKIREILLDKARDKVLTDTRVLMDELVPIVSHRVPTATERGYLERLLRRFLREPRMPVEEVVRLFNEKYPPARDDALQLADDAAAVARQLVGILATIDASRIRDLYPKKVQELLGALNELRQTLTAVVRKLGRRG